MKYYVDQLLDFLDLYQSLIRQGIFASELNKYVEKLNEDIDLLRSISRDPEQKLLEYNYKSLKKDLAKLFHSDQFTGNKTLLENPDELLGKTFGVLDDIEKYKANNQSRTFTNNPYEYSYDDTNSYSSRYYGEEKDENTRAYGERRRRPYSAPKQEETEQYNNEEDEFEYTADTVYEYYGADIWADKKIWLKEKFDYIFGGIPYSSSEYETLFMRYQKKCDKCKDNIDVLNNLIIQLEKELHFLNIERYNAISDERIESLYRKKREKLYNAALKASSELNYFSTLLNNRKMALRPKIDMEFSEWLQEKESYVQRYRELLNYQHYQRENYSTIDFKKLNKEINEAYNYIMDNFMNPSETYQEISEDIYDEDKTYQDIKIKYDKALEAFDEADLNYKNYCSNPTSHKRHIKEPIERDYEKKQRKLRNIIKYKKWRKSFFEKELDKTLEKQEYLVTTYGNEFGPQQGRKK